MFLQSTTLWGITYFLLDLCLFIFFRILYTLIFQCLLFLGGSRERAVFATIVECFLYGVRGWGAGWEGEGKPGITEFPSLLSNCFFIFLCSFIPFLYFFIFSLSHLSLFLCFLVLLVIASPSLSGNYGTCLQPSQSWRGILRTFFKGELLDRKCFTLRLEH